MVTQLKEKNWETYSEPITAQKENHQKAKEDLRGKGIGSKILDQAEKEALVRNCTYSFVNTYQFQAPDFYKKHGYQEVFTLKEYPYSGKRYYFTKDLGPENWWERGILATIYKKDLPYIN